MYLSLKCVYLTFSHLPASSETHVCMKYAVIIHIFKVNYFFFLSFFFVLFVCACVMFVQTSSLVNVKVLQNIEMGRMKIHAKFYRIVK